MTRPVMLSDDQSSQINLMDSLINVAANLGTSKDKRSYTSWTRAGGQPAYANGTNLSGMYSNLSQDRVRLEVMYSEDWLSGKVIDIPVEDMLRQWRKVDFNGNNEMKERFEEAEERFGIREHLEQALKWSDLYGGSGIVIGVDGCGDASLPLNINAIQKGALKFIRTLDRWYLAPQDINYYDISRKNYFKPNYYRIAGTSQLIHHSRLVRFDGILMPRNVAVLNWLWGDSKLQRLYDALTNAATTPNIIAALMFECNIPIVKYKNLIQTIASAGGEEKLQKRASLIALLKSVFNLTLIDSEEDYDIKSPSLGGLDVIAEKFYQFVAGATDIPYTRLMGISPAGMNSTGAADIRNYYDGLKSKQQKRIRPPLKILDSIVLMSTFGYIPPEFSYEFNPLWQMTDKEQADTEYVQAQTDAIYLSNDVIPPSTVAKELRARGTYSTIDDQLIRKVSEDFINKYDPANPERTPGVNESEGGDEQFTGV